MGLKDIQKEFVKLSLNKEAREDAFDSDSIGSNEFEHLKLAINRHAYSLIRKRLGVVKSILRITRMVMGDAFDEEFIKFAQVSEVPSGINRHRKDSIMFADWLVNLKRGSKLFQPLKILLSHELQPIHMWMNKRSFSIKCYNRSPHQMMDFCKNSLPISKARICPTIVIWWETRRGVSCYRWQSFSL